MAQRIVAVRQDGTQIELENGRVAARFVLREGRIQQTFLARQNGAWIPVVDAFHLPVQDRFYWRSAVLHDTDVDPVHRLLVHEGLQAMAVTEASGAQARVTLTGKLSGHAVQQSVTLGAGDDFFHIDVEATLAEEPPSLEYLLSAFTFRHDGAPEFVHTPSLKFESDDIIGDRMFHSPAVILQEGDRFCALVPDVDRINRARVLSPDARQRTTGHSLAVPPDPLRVSMPTGLDLTIQSPFTPRALLSYGLIDAIATHHMHWLHRNDGSMIRRLQSPRVAFAFDLFVATDAPRFQGYRRIGAHLWNRFGAAHLRLPRPQVMPFAQYARTIYPAAFAYRGGTWGWGHTAPPEFTEMDSWVSWEMDGEPVGGFRNNAPMWYDMLSNSPWWNNVRDAVGLHFWGERLGDPDLIDRARRIVNLALLAPQNGGLFATIYRVQRKQWVASHFDPPLETAHNVRPPGFLVGKDSASYHTISCSLTAGHLLRYRKLCRDDDRILPYVRAYADFLVRHIDRQGRVPAWFSPSLQPNAHLLDSGEGGAHLWFLAELYLATGETRYRNAARRIASYLIDNVLPTQRWRDIECYFSCGGKPLNFQDPFQGQEPRGNLAMFWAADGFAALYRATGEQAYLDAGEQVIDYVSLYQSVWAPHFIWVYAFGGWASDNGDAAWLNAHQAWIAGALAWYGKALGRQDLLERAVAAARASVTLIHHSRHIDNGIYVFPNYPPGLGPENIDHEGFSQNCGRTSACCGEESGISCGVGDALRELGGAYVDFAKGLAVGVDGVYVAAFSRTDRRIEVQLENPLAALPVPFEDPFTVELRLAGLEAGEWEVWINAVLAGTISAPERVTLSITIAPTTTPGSERIARVAPTLAAGQRSHEAAAMRWQMLHVPELSRATTRRGAPPWLHVALEYVRQTPDTSVDAWARVVGFSPAQFRRVFQKWVGVTPRAYLRYQRLEEALRLLDRTDQPIQRIAERLGFESLPHFTRLFRQTFGVPPGRYRQQARRDDST